MKRQTKKEKKRKSKKIFHQRIPITKRKKKMFYAEFSITALAQSRLIVNNYVHFACLHKIMHGICGIRSGRSKIIQIEKFNMRL